MKGGNQGGQMGGAQGGVQGGSQGGSQGGERPTTDIEGGAQGGERPTTDIEGGAQGGERPTTDIEGGAQVNPMGGALGGNLNTDSTMDQSIEMVNPRKRSTYVESCKQNQSMPTLWALLILFFAFFKIYSIKHTLKA
jgi:hypothetical protein